MVRRTLSLKNMPPQGTPVVDAIERTCNNCRFWALESSGYGADYSCRRRPPFMDQVTSKGKWPETHPDDWCADFKRLPIETSQ